MQVCMRICLFSTFYWVTYLRFVLISYFYVSECVLEKVQQIESDNFKGVAVPLFGTVKNAILQNL